MAEKINLLNKICQTYFEKNDLINYFLLKGKLIDLSLDCIVKTPGQKPNLDFKIDECIIEFVQKVNLKVLETYNTSLPHSEDEMTIFAKCIDLLNNSNLPKIFETNPGKLREIKSLTYNNLSCIHRKKGNFQMASKAVSHALKIEIREMKTNPNNIETVKNIVSTYLNQAVISSEKRKHENSIKIIHSALDHLKHLEKLLKDKGEEEDYQENYQGYLYLKMVSFFNLAVENEYLNIQSKAITFYQDSLELAKELNNPDIIKKSETALTKFNKNSLKNN